MISKQVYGCLFFMDVRVNDVLRKSKSHDVSWLIFDSPPAGSHPWECFCLCPAECPLQATSCWRLECHLELITEQQSEYFIPHLLSYWQIIPSERSSTTFIVLFIRFFFLLLQFPQLTFTFWWMLEKFKSLMPLTRLSVKHSQRRVSLA